MPRLELPLSLVDYSHQDDKERVKTWIQNREEAVRQLQAFFPVLWAPEFNSQFFSELALARQWGEQFAWDKKTPQDVHLTLRRIDAGNWNSIQSRQGGDNPTYVDVLVNTSYDLLPIFINEDYAVIDGHHRLESYRKIGMSPLVLQISNQPSQSTESKLIAEYDSSVKNRTIVFPRRYKEYIEEKDHAEEQKPDEKADEMEPKMAAKEEKIPLSQVKKLPYKSLNRMIKKMREYLKKNEVVQAMFKEYGVEIEEIDYIPMMFGNLDVCED